jgi:hypothetical protein
MFSQTNGVFFLGGQRHTQSHEKKKKKKKKIFHGRWDYVALFIYLFILQGHFFLGWGGGKGVAGAYNCFCFGKF